MPGEIIWSVACVGEDCAEFELLEAFSQQAELETTRFITTTDVVEAVTPGFSFEAPFALCTLKDFIECRRKFGNVDAYRKPPPSNTDYFKLIGDHVLSFLHWPKFITCRFTIWQSDAANTLRLSQPSKLRRVTVVPMGSGSLISRDQPRKVRERRVGNLAKASGGSAVTYLRGVVNG